MSGADQKKEARAQKKADLVDRARRPPPPPPPASPPRPSALPTSPANVLSSKSGEKEEKEDEEDEENSNNNNNGDEDDDDDDEVNNSEDNKETDDIDDPDGGSGLSDNEKHQRELQLAQDKKRKRLRGKEDDSDKKKVFKPTLEDQRKVAGTQKEVASSFATPALPRPTTPPAPFVVSPTHPSSSSSIKEEKNKEKKTVVSPAQTPPQQIHPANNDGRSPPKRNSSTVKEEKPSSSTTSTVRNDNDRQQQQQQQQQQRQSASARPNNEGYSTNNKNENGGANDIGDDINNNININSNSSSNDNNNNNNNNTDNNNNNNNLSLVPYGRREDNLRVNLANLKSSIEECRDEDILKSLQFQEYVLKEMMKKEESRSGQKYDPREWRNVLAYHNYRNFKLVAVPTINKMVEENMKFTLGNRLLMILGPVLRVGRSTMCNAGERFVGSDAGESSTGDSASESEKLKNYKHSITLHPASTEEFSKEYKGDLQKEQDDFFFHLKGLLLTILGLMWKMDRVKPAEKTSIVRTQKKKDGKKAQNLSDFKDLSDEDQQGCLMSFAEGASLPMDMFKSALKGDSPKDGLMLYSKSFWANSAQDKDRIRMQEKFPPFGFPWNLNPNNGNLEYFAKKVAGFAKVRDSNKVSLATEIDNYYKEKKTTIPEDLEPLQPRWDFYDKLADAFTQKPSLIFSPPPVYSDKGGELIFNFNRPEVNIAPSGSMVRPLFFPRPFSSASMYGVQGNVKALFIVKVGTPGVLQNHIPLEISQSSEDIRTVLFKSVGKKNFEDDEDEGREEEEGDDGDHVPVSSPYSPKSHGHPFMSDTRNHTTMSDQ
jgi:hypothetical protein